jgi:hypothetical protein
MIFPVEKDRVGEKTDKEDKKRVRGKTIEGKKENKSNGERKKDQRERISLYMMSSSVI